MISITYHFFQVIKFKSTYDTITCRKSESNNLRRRPSQWSYNSIVLVHWRFFRLAKQYLSRMSKLESAELLRLRQTSVGHKVNIPHASVFRFTNIFIDESKRFMPGAYLQTYRGVPLWFSVIVAVLSFGGAATLTGAIIFLIFGFPFITIYWQNEQVNRKSLSLVKKQSMKNDQQTLNALYEVTFEEHHHPIHHINLYLVFAPLRLRKILTDERYGSPIFFHISLRNPKNVSTKMFYLYLQS